MLRHVACFAWNDGTSPADIGRVEAMLAALPEQISEIRSYSFGRDVGIREGAFDYGVVADFDDADGWRTYQQHPAHRAVLDEMLVHARERVSVQFEWCS
jgi:hypothetical protein